MRIIVILSLLLGLHFASWKHQHGPSNGGGSLRLAHPGEQKTTAEVLGLQILNYSSVAAPLHPLTSTNSKFAWTLETDQAFSLLKSCYTSAPILIPPDLAQQFVVEIDASNSGVGAVLSRHSERDNYLHPCAIFPHHLLFSAKYNYDIGDRELLAIKMALEEWCHWLEGADKPFIVLTDHKNIEYSKAAKR